MMTIKMKIKMIIRIIIKSDLDDDHFPGKFPLFSVVAFSRRFYHQASIHSIFPKDTLKRLLRLESGANAVKELNN